MIELPQSMRVFERGWLSSNNVLFADDARTVLVEREPTGVELPAVEFDRDP